MEKTYHRSRDRHSARHQSDDHGVERPRRHRSYHNNDLRDKCPREYHQINSQSGRYMMDTANMVTIRTNQDVQQPNSNQYPYDWEPYRQRDARHAARRDNVNFPAQTNHLSLQRY